MSLRYSKNPLVTALFIISLLFVSGFGYAQEAPFSAPRTTAALELNRLAEGAMELYAKTPGRGLQELVQRGSNTRPWDLLILGKLKVYAPETWPEGSALLSRITDKYRNYNYSAASAYFHLGLATALMTGDFEKGAGMLAEIEILPPNPFQDQANLYRGLLLMMAGRGRGWQEALEKGAKKYLPGTPGPDAYGCFDDSRFLLAWGYHYLAGDFKSAAAEYGRVLSDYPDSRHEAEALYQLAKVSIVMGDLTMAGELLKRCSRKAGGSLRLRDCLNLTALLESGDRAKLDTKIKILRTADLVTGKRLIKDFAALWTDGKSRAHSAQLEKALDIYMKKHPASPFSSLCLAVKSLARLALGRISGAGETSDLFSANSGALGSELVRVPGLLVKSSGRWKDRQRLLGELAQSGVPDAELPMEQILCGVERAFISCDAQAWQSWRNTMSSTLPEFQQMTSFIDGIMAMGQGREDEALGYLQESIDKYFQSPIADDAQYLMAEILFSQWKRDGREKQRKLAVMAFQKLMLDNPRTDYASEASLKMATLSKTGK